MLREHYTKPPIISARGLIYKLKSTGAVALEDMEYPLSAGSGGSPRNLKKITFKLVLEFLE